MTRMFTVDGQAVRTRSPITGCDHNCVYCWSKRLVRDKLGDTPKYRNGFAPTMHHYVLKSTYGKGYTWFIVDMGDMWCKGVKDEWITAVLDSTAKADPRNTFMFCTKNPRRYVDYFSQYPTALKPNYILGVTIESNRDFGATQAPKPEARHQAMVDLRGAFPNVRTFVSVEPIMEFDHDIVVDWVADVKPESLYIGYDNYKCGLIEPPLIKTKNLISKLEQYTRVIPKTLREKI